MSAINQEICPVCKATLRKSTNNWHLYCSVCDYESSRFKPELVDSTLYESIDVEKWEIGLKNTRLVNYEKIISVLKKYKKGGRLLDVGCANGWFLEVVQKDYEALGVEPQQKFQEICAARNLKVIHGIFPECLNPSDTYDIITFNDVLEHIPDATSIIEACLFHLKKDGIVMINIPTSDGFIYKVSRLLSLVGLHQYYYRMWQKETYTPHIHYFNRKNLVRILENHNFSILETGNLETLVIGNIKELYNRVVNVQKENRIFQLFAFFAVLISYPILRFLPRDIMYVVAKK